MFSDFFFEQIASINQQTDHLDKAYQSIADLADTNSAVEQSDAIVEIIRERESTNRKALSLLEGMFENKSVNPKENVIHSLIVHNSSGRNDALIRELLQEL